MREGAKPAAAWKRSAAAFGHLDPVGDPPVGEFDYAVVLVTVGDVPADLAGFTG